VQVVDPGVFRAVELVDADPDGLFGVHARRKSLRVGVAEEFPGRFLQRFDLVL